MRTTQTDMTVMARKEEMNDSPMPERNRPRRDSCMMKGEYMILLWWRGRRSTYTRNGIRGKRRKEMGEDKQRRHKERKEMEGLE